MSEMKPLPPIDTEYEVVPETPVVVQTPAVNQPTGHLTQKMTAVGISGGFVGSLVAWLKYRVGIDITAIDVALFSPIFMVAAGYFMREKAPAWLPPEFIEWLKG